ncbi:MAG: Pr6Pr family membrane protein [Solirubrobacterales bacterium]
MSQWAKTVTIPSKAGIAIKVSMIIAILIGTYFSSLLTAKVEGASTFYYFTVQSNWFIGIMAAVFLYQEIRTRQKVTSQLLYSLKYLATTAVALTFTIFSVVLLPTVPLDYLMSWGNVLLHDVVPVLAVLDYLLYDTDFKAEAKNIAWTVIMPVCYFGFVMLGLLLDFRYIDNQRIPYFFLDFHKLGWFGLGPSGPGVFYWLLMTLAAVAALGALLIWAMRMRKRRLHPGADTIGERAAG